MRKRRYPGGGLSEAIQTLNVLIKAAASTQKQLPSSVAATAPTLPPLSEGMSLLNSLDSLKTVSSESLEKLLAEISTARAEQEDQLSKWEDLGKQLKSALDALLLIITLKSEPTLPKRRRTAATAEEIPVKNNNNNDDDDDEDDGDNDEDEDNNNNNNADDSEESGGSEEDDSDADDSPKSNNTTTTTTEVPVPPTTTGTIGGKSQGTQEPPLGIGRQVAFKLPRSAVDEWIQCEITRVITPNSRFEVRDPEPDEKGNPGKTYQARIRDIMPLPLPDQIIKPLPPGSVVFARYPETTAFYKAKVSSYSPKRRSYFLKFEGEEDAQKEIEAKDTLVLPTARGRR